MKNRKYYISCLICAALLFFFRTVRFEAMDEPASKKSGTGHAYVYDLMGTISQDELEKIRENLSPLAAYFDVHVVFANEFLLSRNLRKALGKKEDEDFYENGLLIEFHREEDYASGYLNCDWSIPYRYLHEADDSLLEESISHLKKGDYAGAVQEVASRAVKMIEMDRPACHNSETSYEAMVSDYTGALTKEEKTSLLEKARPLTQYTHVLISIGTLRDLFEPKKQKQEDDRYSFRTKEKPENYYFYDSFQHWEPNIEKRILHIYVNSQTAGIQIPGMKSVLVYYRDNCCDEEGVQKEDETETTQTEGMTFEFGLLDQQTEAKACRLAGRKEYAACAGLVMDSIAHVFDTLLPERDPEGTLAMKQIPLKDVTIIDMMDQLKKEDKAALRKTMENTTSLGKMVFITYSSGNDEKSDRQFLWTVLPYVDCLPSEGILVMYDASTRKMHIHRQRKAGRGIPYGKRREMDDEVNEERQKNGLVAAVQMAFEKTAEYQENAGTEKQVVNLLRLTGSVITAVILAFIIGLQLTYRGRLDQISKPDDVVNGDTANIQEK